MSSCHCNAFLRTGLAQDILRNVTYVLHNGNRIGVVNGSTYSFLFQRSTAKSLTVDWVANVLYWIEGGSMVSNGIWFDSVDVCAQAVMCTVCLWLPLCVCNHTRKCVYCFVHIVCLYIHILRRS